MGITLGRGMRRTVQSIGSVFVIISLALLLIALVTDYWLVINVDRAAVRASETGLASYSRTRGIYRECWESSDRAAVESGSFSNPSL